MRVTVTIEPRTDDQWAITTTWGGIDEPIRRTAARVDSPPWIDTEPPAASDVRAALVAAVTALRRGRVSITEAAPERIGRWLYAVLLDAASWERVLALADGAVTEIALHCPHQEARVLHDLPWELMHTGERYLALLAHRPIVVTRHVATKAKADLAPRPGPPTVLFAVGSELTDKRVRAGAEFMALMRELGSDADRIDPHVLEGASLTTLAESVGRTSADVVYLIGHGKADIHATLLQLRDDDDPRKEKLVSAAQVLTALEHALKPPSVVILSACDQAVAPADRTASFAADLAEAGVPVVVAMAGRITDKACRIFMRRFASALIDGSPLTKAIADGRRAAFWQEHPRSGTADWSLPCVYFCSGVPADFAAVETGARDRTASRVLHKMSLASHDSVFCGRREFFAHYADIAAPGGRELLVIRTDDVSGLGRQRLLRELAGQALRDGHIPCYLEDVAGRGGRGLRTARELGVRVLEWIRAIREYMGLPQDSQCTLLGCMGGTAPQAEDDVQRRIEIAEAIDAVREMPDQIGAERLRQGIAADMHRLVDDAVAAGWPGTGEHSRPLMLLRGIQTWGDLVDLLANQLLTADGIGTDSLPVPVIATWRRGSEGDVVLRDWSDRIADSGWARFAEMGPFSQASGEDLLAYEWTMLLPRVSGEPVHAVVNAEGLWLEHARALVKGNPGTLIAEPQLMVAATTIGKLSDPADIVEGDDNLCMREYAERGLVT